MNKIYLASKSPRRKEILNELGLDFEIIDSDYEEDNSLDISPIEMAKIHSIGKAKGALKNITNGTIIGSDNFVVLDNKPIFKPLDKEDARRILKSLSGRTHEVIGGICFLDAKTNKTTVKSCTSKVTFITLSDEVIDKYLEVASYMDKAGAYGIQDEASVFIEKVEGSITNIIGSSKEIIKEYFKLD